jgi:hypothetical protein
VVDDGVRPGVAGSKEFRQGFSGTAGAVVGVGEQRVEPETLLLL